RVADAGPTRAGEDRQEKTSRPDVYSPELPRDSEAPKGRYPEPPVTWRGAPRQWIRLPQVALDRPLWVMGQFQLVVMSVRVLSLVFGTDFRHISRAPRH